MHPVPLLLELPDPVVLPRHLDPADEVEVVAPLEQLVEGVGRLAEVDLVEQRRRERVGVAEEDLARRAGEQSSYQHWIRAMWVNSSLVHGASGSRPISV